MSFTAQPAAGLRLVRPEYRVSVKMSVDVWLLNTTVNERPVSVLSKQSETVSLPTPSTLPKNLIRFARLTEEVRGSPCGAVVPFADFTTP